MRRRTLIQAGAWSAAQALGMLPALHDARVEMLEQPVAGHDLAGLRFVRERAALPVVADESCVTATDIPRLAGAVDGVNIKLAKCGSLREALRMIAVARAHDLRVMCGCMIETTLGIAAAARQRGALHRPWRPLPRHDRRAAPVGDR